MKTANTYALRHKLTRYGLIALTLVILVCAVFLFL